MSLKCRYVYLLQLPIEFALNLFDCQDQARTGASHLKSSVHIPQMLPWCSLREIFLVVIGVHAGAAVGGASQASWQYISSPAKNNSWQSSSALGSQETYDRELFAPFEYLNKLSEEKYTSLGHPLFPHYGVRIKKSNFCDGTVKYVDGSDMISL
jgi:hypothetical protein